MKKIISTTTLLAIISVFTSSCKKDVKVNPNGAPQTAIPAQFAGSWSSSSVGLTTYWNQGSYDGSYGNTVKTVVLKSNGTAEDYGYYEGSYSSIFFYRYTCTATYTEESDGSVTITEYPVGGEQIIGSGPKKPIASENLYPNKKIIMRNCTVETENGKTYLSYYLQQDDGNASTTASRRERLDN